MKFQRIRSLPAFWSRRDGNVAIVFSLMLPAAMMVVGAGVDYARVNGARAALQTAVDSAALEAAALAKNTQNMTSAQSYAQSVLSTNLPRGFAATTKTVAVTSPSANNFKAVATVSGTVSTVLSKIVGSMTVSATATATSAVTTGGGGAGAQNAKGGGYTVADPHVLFANSSTGQTYSGEVDCADGKWYNYLSDGGLQWNSQCMVVSGSPYMGASQIMVGTHTISFSLLQGYYNSGADDNYPWDCVSNASVSLSYQGTTTNCGLAWPAILTVDGVVQKPGSYSDGISRVITLISDTANGITVTAEMSGWKIPSGWTTSSNYANYVDIDIKTPNYEIMFQNAWGWQDSWISVNNGGMCGAPGGIYGSFIAGKPDYTFANYVVSSTYTGPQFGWTPNCGATSQGNPRLVN